MIDLSNISLICIEPLNPDLGHKVLKYSSREIAFGETILVSNQKPIDFDGNFFWCPEITWAQYNDFVLQAVQYTTKDFALFIQTDGFVLNPSLFQLDWLEYDYLGAPWPDQSGWLSLQTPRLQSCFKQKTRVGNGGFSLRSRKFMELSSRFESTQGLGEDNFLCVEKYQYMIDAGIKFAPPEVAVKFSVENPITEMGILDWKDTGHPAFNTNHSFGFHGKNLKNFNEIMCQI